MPSQDDELAIMASKQYYVEYGSDVTTQGLYTFLPSCIPVDLLAGPGAMDAWCARVKEVHARQYRPDTPEGERPSAEDVAAEVAQGAKTRWTSCFTRRSIK